MVADHVELNDALGQLDANGYVLFKNAVSKDKLAVLATQISDAYEAARATGAMFDGGGSISGHLNCFPGEQSRFVLDDLRRAGVLEVIGALAPGSVERLRVNCNVNLPNSVAQHYHIDGYYAQDFYLCTVAVIDTDLTNGAMDVLPGTNRRYYKFWQYAIRRKYRLSTRVIMEQGDVVLRKSTLWHRGMPNHSAALRPQLTFTFGETGAPQTDPFKMNDGSIYFEPNWYAPSRFGRLRERLFVKAPFVDSTYRFTRSLVGKKGYLPEKRFGDFTTPAPRRSLSSRLRGVRR